MKPINLRKQFGLRVRELRVASGASQETFADKCGFARSYMSRIERGGANPSLDAIKTLADALEVPIKDLFDVPTLTPVTKSGAAAKVKVPFAKDGSYFSPEVRRPQTEMFTVGGKDQPVTFKEFEKALAHLKKMDVARWQRPNAQGNWGVVAAVRWDVLPEKASR